MIKGKFMTHKYKKPSFVISHFKKERNVDIDQGIYKVKLKVALNEKRKKLHGFSFSINMANFEAFCWVKKFNTSPNFLECGMYCRRI